MAARSRTHQHTLRGSTAPKRGLSAVLIAVGLIATTSCTPTPEPQPVSDPVKLLQHVRVGLSPAAGVETIEGTTISVTATGESSTEDTEYSTAETVGELPVRVSLQYRAGGRSGSDLAELQGHTGPVEIDLTLENLTVKPQAIEYDAAGQTRTDTALVGAPLTIAASTKLDGVRADDVTPGSADGTTGTNGVLSSTEDGAAVVQWATVLAPPRSGASTTLRLVADVEDFQVPSFDLAVQPGLNTDLSADAVITGAFSSGTGSELDLQRRTITLVSDVNTVLTKAGSTITDVRQNLETTSETLGVETAAELRDNSEALADTMLDLKEQLKTLGTDLEAATNATRSTTMSQLQQTVSAVDSMLGDTTAARPTVPIDGDGCTAEVPKPGQTATVYSSILTMAAQLDAYAKVSADCRDSVADSLRATVGPENPTPEECARQGSVTCSLRGSATTVTVALLGLANEGLALVNDLQPQISAVDAAITNQQDTADALTKVRADIANFDGTEADDSYQPALESMKAAIRSAQKSAGATRTKIGELHEHLDDIKGTATVAQSELVDGTSKYSIMQQNEQLAAELCRLADRGRISATDAEHLRSYLTATPCGPEEPATNEPTPGPTPTNEPTPGPTPTNEPTPGPTPTGPTMDRVMNLQAPGDVLPPLDLIPPFEDPMDVRLNNQAIAWSSVLATVETITQDKGAIQALDALDIDIAEIDRAVSALDVAARADQGELKSLINAALDEVLGSSDGAIGSSEQLAAKLLELQVDQNTLKDKISALGTESENAATEIKGIVDDQVREVAEVGDAGSASVIAAFDRSISGLTSTSDEVVTDAGGTVDKQRNELNERGDALAASLDERTQSSLANIASSTSGSTRDVEGAAALLSSSLNNVMLDLGDRSVNGSGLLGSMATSAAKADTADFQLALASQNAEGYTNIRSRDVDGLLLRQAQFKASLTAVEKLPPFHLEVPAGATSQTLYTLTIGSGA